MQHHISNEQSMEMEARRAYTEGKINRNDLIRFLAYIAHRGEEAGQKVAREGRIQNTRKYRPYRVRV